MGRAVRHAGAHGLLVGTETVDRSDVARMLRSAAERVRAEKATLSVLDSHGGDGDHGTTMARAMDRLEGALDGDDVPEAGKLMKAVGWAIMGVDGGAIGPLLGSFFSSMAPAAPEGAIDGPAFAALFEAGLGGLLKNTRARVGDKTLVDALVPAVGELRSAVDAGEAIPDALTRAAEAAERGAASTVELEARFGRAKHLGPGSKGHADPGATSIALLFKGLEEGATGNG